jgi:beta-propeller repeat-containing protein
MREKLLVILVVSAFLAGIHPGQLFAQTLNLDYSTYLGGSGYDEGNGISVGIDGRIYITGDTSSYDFPTQNPYQARLSGYHNAFVTALSSTGSALSYSIYLGGSDNDWGQAISLGTDGRTYVTGYTSSYDFPMKNPYQTVYAGGYYDAFVTALSSTGSALSYSTYLGGSGVEGGDGISLGTDGMAYVTGRTDSRNFPMKNPYQAGRGGIRDAFVTALSSTGSALSYSTYLGGSDNDWGQAISLGTDGRTYVTGNTHSSDFPLKNPYQAIFYGGGYPDTFVTALSSAGSALSYSTYLGGSGPDWGQAISLGIDGTAYVTGETGSYDFPMENPYQASHSGGFEDAFVSALSSTGSALSYSTYLGGDGPDRGYGISMGTDGTAYVIGYTCSSDFPMKNPYQTVHGGGTYDAFVSALSSTGSALSYSTYLGGSGNDSGSGISLGTDGTAYVTGGTLSSDFPTKNPYQAGLSGHNNAFVTSLTFIVIPTSLSLVIDSGDYDGDGTSDVGIFRESSGLWAIRDLSRVYYGMNGDIPSSGDYDGDATTDITVFRGSSGLWAPRGVTRLYYGGASDIPAPGDYDGDGTCDAAIFRGSTGLWAAREVTRVYFGGMGDLPVPLYGSGRDFPKDIGIFRPDTGLWAIRGITRIYYGGSSDQPLIGNWTAGAGNFDIGIYRESTGLWAIRDITRVYYGGTDDLPVPANYNGLIPESIGIFRDSTGLWAIKDITRIYFGATSDLPISGPAINPSSAATL